MANRRLSPFFQRVHVRGVKDKTYRAGRVEDGRNDSSERHRRGEVRRVTNSVRQRTRQDCGGNGLASLHRARATLRDHLRQLPYRRRTRHSRGKLSRSSHRDGRSGESHVLRGRNQICRRTSQCRRSNTRRILSQLRRTLCTLHLCHLNGGKTRSRHTRDDQRAHIHNRRRRARARSRESCRRNFLTRRLPTPLRRSKSRMCPCSRPGCRRRRRFNGTPRRLHALRIVTSYRHKRRRRRCSNGGVLRSGRARRRPHRLFLTRPRVVGHLVSGNDKQRNGRATRRSAIRPLPTRPNACHRSRRCRAGSSNAHDGGHRTSRLRGLLRTRFRSRYGRRRSGTCVHPNLCVDHIRRQQYVNRIETNGRSYGCVSWRRQLLRFLGGRNRGPHAGRCRDWVDCRENWV